MISLDNFLHSLCRYMASEAGLVYLTDTDEAPRTLSRGRTVDPKAATFSVVRFAGGPSADFDPITRRTIQIWTLGKDCEPAIAQSQKLYEALFGVDGRPVRMLVIPGYAVGANTSDGHWRINSSDPLQPPSPLGPDAKGREQVSWNTELAFIKKD